MAPPLRQRDSITLPPVLSLPSKCPPAKDSRASSAPLKSRTIRRPRSYAHLRLLTKFAGHPFSGATVPCSAPGAPPRPMKQAPPAAAVNRQRPPRSAGKAEAAAVPAPAPDVALPWVSGFGLNEQAAKATIVSAAANARL